MCFSVTASFAAATILIPSGMYCFKVVNDLDRPYWAFALIPFLFGLQQLLEGMVWHTLLSDDVANSYFFALGYLLFSHVIWLVWVPYTSFLIEQSTSLRNVFKFLGVLGVIFGSSMFLPLLIYPEWLSVSIVNESISYKVVLLSNGYVSQPVLTIGYAIIILAPLLLSSDRNFNIFGVMIMLSGLCTWVLYKWVFISVWCYFSAVISLYIFIILLRAVNSTKVVKPA